MLAKKIFGDDHEICYDTIINHNAYDFLRVSIEVPRNQSAEAFVLLNGKEVGKIIVSKKHGKTEGYTWFRFAKQNDRNAYVRMGQTRELGKAVARIITDFANQ